MKEIRTMTNLGGFARGGMKLAPDSGGGDGGETEDLPHEKAFKKAHPIVRDADPETVKKASDKFNANPRRRGLTLGKNGEMAGAVIPANSGEVAAGSKPLKIVDLMADPIGNHQPDLRFDTIEEAVAEAQRRGFNFIDLA